MTIAILKNDHKAIQSCARKLAISDVHCAQPGFKPWARPSQARLGQAKPSQARPWLLDENIWA